jgi:hypothetical protein
VNPMLLSIPGACCEELDAGHLFERANEFIALATKFLLEQNDLAGSQATY